MRDLLVTIIVFGSLPFILRKPYVGVLMWVWISVMNPHTQGWGFATNFPFASVIAATTLLSLMLTEERKGIPVTPVTIALIAFVAWINVTTLTALLPEFVYRQWSTVMKVMLMTLVTMMLIRDREQIQRLVWVLVVSLGFYGVKGGIFTIASGGTMMVWGPGKSIIGGNNEIALALVMTIPLMHYLQTLTERKLVRHGLTAAMGLSALAALGTYSRGAFLAIVVMAAFLAAKSRYKIRIGILVLASLPLMIGFMPDKWSSRMDTILEYQTDGSANGRINAWWMAFNLAKDRPLVGGGFEIYEPQFFMRYAPNPDDVHAAHSIYFQALGEHGFVGLGLFLLLALLTWRTGNWIIRHTEKMDDLKWAHDLAKMIQVSLVGFAVGGAFLSLLYFDVPYYLMAILVATRVLVEKHLRQTRTAEKGRHSASLVPPPIHAAAPIRRGQRP